MLGHCLRFSKFSPVSIPSKCGVVQKSETRNIFPHFSHTRTKKPLGIFPFPISDQMYSAAVEMGLDALRESIRMATATQRRQFGHPQATTTTATAAAPQYAPPAASDPPRVAAAVTRGGKKRKLEELEDKNQELKEESQKLKEESQKHMRSFTTQVQANNKNKWFWQGKFDGMKKLLEELIQTLEDKNQKLERQSWIWQGKFEMMEELHDAFIQRGRVARAPANNQEAPPAPPVLRTQDTEVLRDEYLLRRPELMCPITQTVMIDPVFTSNGHTYERKAIERWLKKKLTDPLTNEAVSDTLIPNKAMKSEIQEMPFRF
jgi:hypothetical protein